MSGWLAIKINPDKWGSTVLYLPIKHSLILVWIMVVIIIIIPIFLNIIHTPSFS